MKIPNKVTSNTGSQILLEVIGPPASPLHTVCQDPSIVAEILTTIKYVWESCPKGAMRCRNHVRIPGDLFFEFWDA